MNCLFPRYFLLGLCLVPAWEICSPVATFGNEPTNGLLVLRNGNVIEGRISRLADHYQVQLERGQLQVRVNQVEMLCQTFDEAYERRREMRTGSTADSHLQLAYWCLRHKLNDYAARELLEARAIDPNHRKLSLLERQLNQALKYQKKVPSLPLHEKSVKKEIQVDQAMLDRAPQWARAMFVRKIQPMLVKSCATSGCHHKESANEFQLNRLAIVGAGHPAATKYNLVSVLNQIDFKNSEASQLLHFANAGHGDEQSTVLSARQMQLLSAWVEQLVAPNKPNLNDAAVEQASFITVGPSSVARLSETYKHSREIAEKQSKPEQTGNVRSDPFDPDIFNRLYPARKNEPKKSQAIPPPKMLPLLGEQSQPGVQPLQEPQFQSVIGSP